LQAVILAGGMGTRLRPLTMTRPKVLLPVCNRAIMGRQIDAVAGLVEEVIVAAGYRGEYIEKWAAEVKPGSPEVTVVREREPLGTGGALVNIWDRLDEEFLAMNGDIVTDMDFAKLLGKSGMHSTIVAVEVEDTSRYGNMSLDGDMVVNFSEKRRSAGPGIVNSALYLLKRSDLDLLPPGRSSLERELFPVLARRGVLAAHMMPGEDYWLDVGTPASYLAANLDCAEREPMARIGANAKIEGRIDGSSCIGRSCAVSRGCTVEGSLLLDGVELEEDVEVRGSIIGTDSKVGAGSRLISTVLGDRTLLPPGSRSQSG